MQDKAAALVELKNWILSTEENQWVKESYAAKIAEQLQKINMLLAVTDKDDQLFFKHSKSIYGAPDIDELRIGIATALIIADKKDVRLATVLQRMAQDLRVKKSDGLSDIMLDKPSEPLLSATEIKEQFLAALRGLEIDWGVVLRDSAQNIYVDYTQRVVVIPATREEYASVVQGLIAHEICTHLQRHQAGLQSSLLLLSRGLAGYLLNEEGLAAYQELQVSRAYIPGLALYVGTAVATGIAGKKPGSFADVFEAIKSVFDLQSKCTGRPASTKITDETWKRTVRIFRGVHEIGSGYCFTRDISYWKGYLKIREQIADGGSVEDLLKGKF